MMEALNLEVIRDEAAFLALEPCWKTLMARAAFTTPFMTWDWVRLWWQRFHMDFQLRVGVLKTSSGVVEAIAPLVLGKEGSGMRKHLRHLTLMGGMGDVVSEGLDFIIAKGREKELVPRFQELITRCGTEWDVLDVPMLHEESPNAAPLMHLLARQGPADLRCPPHNAYVLKLEPTWDELLAKALSRNRRNDFRSKWKKFINEHDGEALVGGRDLPVDEAMDDLFALHRVRFEDVDTTFIADRAVDFHRTLARQWVPEGKVIISLLRSAGKPAAARYGFVHGGRYWDYQSGFDERFASVSVGNLNLGWAVQNAIAKGLTEYDHLAGTQTYKVAWSTRSRHYLHLECLNVRSPRALVFRIVRSLKRLATGHQAPAAIPYREVQSV